MGSEQELNDAIRELAVTRSALSDVLSRIKLYRNAIAEANIRIYAGELWRIDPEGGELLEPLRVALERANDDLELREPSLFVPHSGRGDWTCSTWFYADKPQADIPPHWAGTHIVGYSSQEANLIPAPAGDEWFWFYADAARDAQDYRREWERSAERAALVPDADRQMERR